jgi:hypothetical protein
MSRASGMIHCRSNDRKTVARRFDHRLFVVDHCVQPLFMSGKTLMNGFSDVFISGLFIPQVRMKERLFPVGVLFIDEPLPARPQ